MDFTAIPYLIERKPYHAVTLWRVADVATINGNTVVELEDAKGTQSQVGGETPIIVHRTVSYDAEYIEAEMKHGRFEAVYPKTSVPKHLDEQMDEHLASRA